MSGKQDDLAGPLVSSIRAAMRAIDKIAAAVDVPNAERVSAITRVLAYAGQRATDVANEPLEEESPAATTSPL